MHTPTPPLSLSLSLSSFLSLLLLLLNCCSHWNASLYSNSLCISYTKQIMKKKKKQLFTFSFFGEEVLFRVHLRVHQREKEKEPNKIDLRARPRCTYYFSVDGLRDCHQLHRLVDCDGESCTARVRPSFSSRQCGCVHRPFFASSSRTRIKHTKWCLINLTISLQWITWL